MVDLEDPQRPAWASPFEAVLPPAATFAPAPSVPADPLIGTPQADTRVWAGQQEHGNTCAIRCQEFIIAQYTGQDPGEDALLREARDHGWFGDGGTPSAAVGNLLESHGIAVTRFAHANIFNLSNELAMGHKVIVGVNAETLWEDQPLLNDLSGRLGLGPADHAVVVSGIDTSDPAHVAVIVSDPGTGQAVARYPLEQFVAAWEGSDFFMVATREPPPAARQLPEMAHFDYQQGHIDSVWNLSYDAFTALADHASQWTDALADALAHLADAVSALTVVDPGEVTLLPVGPPPQPTDDADMLALLHVIGVPIADRHPPSPQAEHTPGTSDVPRHP